MAPSELTTVLSLIPIPRGLAVLLQVTRQLETPHFRRLDEEHWTSHHVGSEPRAPLPPLPSLVVVVVSHGRGGIVRLLMAMLLPIWHLAGLPCPLVRRLPVEPCRPPELCLYLRWLWGQFFRNNGPLGCRALRGRVESVLLRIWGEVDTAMSSIWVERCRGRTEGLRAGGF